MKTIVLAVYVTILLVVSTTAQTKGPTCGMEKTVQVEYKWIDLHSENNGYIVGPIGRPVATEVPFHEARLLLMRYVTSTGQDLTVLGLVKDSVTSEVSRTPGRAGDVLVKKKRIYTVWPIEPGCRASVEREVLRLATVHKWQNAKITSWGEVPK